MNISANRFRYRLNSRYINGRRLLSCFFINNVVAGRRRGKSHLRFLYRMRGISHVMVGEFQITVPGNRVFTEIQCKARTQAVVLVIVMIKAVYTCGDDAKNIDIVCARYIIIGCYFIAEILGSSQMCRLYIGLSVSMEVLGSGYSRHSFEWQYDYGDR